MSGTLLVVALGDESRARVQQADEVHSDVGRPGALALLEKDEVLGRRRAASAIVLRPVDPGVAGVVQLPLPGGVERSPSRPVVGRSLRWQHRKRACEPVAELEAELLLRR